MSKFAKGKSWLEHRISDAVELEGKVWTVNLLARKGTGVQGFRMSVVFIPHDGGADVEASLPNVTTTADVHRVTRELQADPAQVQRLYSDALAQRA